MRPLVKICGITNYEDAALALALGADLLGFILAPSPRRVAPGAAADIVRRLREGGLLAGRTTVAVFVNEAPAVMAEVLATTGLGLAQIHGDEAPEACARLPFPWYRALRLRARGDAARLVGGSGEAWACSRLLFDAAVPGAYGGTGTRIDAEVAREAGGLARLGGREFFLAGGIGPGNVADILRGLGPDGIDVGSGVEEAPGRKSPEALRRFFAAIDDFARTEEDA